MNERSAARENYEITALLAGWVASSAGAMGISYLGENDTLFWISSIAFWVMFFILNPLIDKDIERLRLLREAHEREIRVLERQLERMKQAEDEDER